jgi:hypothetical protein
VKALKTLLLSSVAALGFWAAACGGGSSNGPMPISVALSPVPPSSITVSTTANLTAIVSNDDSGGGVTWTVSCGSTQCGSFNPASTSSGSATTFAAPANIPSNSTVTVVATSKADTTKSASATITIAASTGVSVSFIAQPPAALVSGATSNLIALVSGDSHDAGVTWSVTCSSAQCGNFNPASTASNAPTVFTAPAAVPTGNSVKIVATSVTDKTKSASATINIAAPALADGNYIFHLEGEDQSGPLYAAGAITVQNGAITGGEVDYVDLNRGQNDTISPTGSGIATSSGGNVQITLNTADSYLGVNGTITIRGTAVSASRMLISQFDGSGAATGSLDLQTGKAAPAGGYAFNLSGLDGSLNPNALVIGGILNISGSSVVAGSSVFDYNDGGVVGQAQTFAVGSVTAPDSFGRFTINLTPSNSSVISQFGLSAYIIGTNRIVLVENLQDRLNGVLGGNALGQGSNTGAFTWAKVAGTTYVYTAVGADATGILTIGGGFSLNSNGTVTGNLALADLTCCGGTTITGNWTVGPLGRVTISNVTPSLVRGVPFAFQLYLDGDGNALELGVDSSQNSAGNAYLQSTGAVDSGNYALGSLGFANLNNLPFWSAVGPVDITGSSINGFTDYNIMGTLTPGAVLSGALNPGRGLFAITGLDVTNTASDNYGYYPIDNSRVLAIEVDQNQLGLLLFEGVNP